MDQYKKYSLKKLTTKNTLPLVFIVEINLRNLRSYHLTMPDSYKFFQAVSIFPNPMAMSLKINP